MLLLLLFYFGGFLYSHPYTYLKLSLISIWSHEDDHNDEDDTDDDEYDADYDEVYDADEQEMKKMMMMIN